jgi:hypothetical protein
MKVKKVYHMGIPVDDLDRARDFYTRVLGMEYLGRIAAIRTTPTHCRSTARYSNSIECVVATMILSCSSVRALSNATRWIKTASLITPSTWIGMNTTMP